MKLLIVDDEQTNITLIKAALKDLDFEIIVACDGEEGLKMAQEEMPEIIVLDVMMPKYDGFKVCGMLKSDRRYSHIHVVILSSRAGEDDLQLAREVGADIYMVKPFDQDELNRNVKTLLNQTS